MSVAEPLWEKASLHVNLLYNFPSARLRVCQMKEGKKRVIEFNLSQLQRAAGSPGQRHFQSYCCFHSTFCLFTPS